MSEEIGNEKNKIIEKVAEKDKKFIEMAVDAVEDYFNETKNTEKTKCSNNDKICPSMIAKECKGMPFVNETRIQQVLDVMANEGILDREIPEGTGIPHYFKK
ncbi:MAG: hypothetical protein BTN85_1611 [Candidatus Methanohalarchaeum thermophilum]|uniref:Uncharacterized protein n=1 Tax=Methanohalarchaeum thermophilum TaxID=1903181 RepID=A0A1Q6DXL6_METT1|nr:MAG: hypothetical protein BTN85_1611 [Candidatus Methanohalarchaeum thermophilum]